MAKNIATSTLGTAPDTYLYALAQSGNAFATIGSDDNLRTFDAALRPIHAVPGAHTGISCLEAHAGNGFATAGRDGVVRFWDPRGQRAGVELAEPRGNGISAITCYGDFSVAVGTESVKEGLGDVSVLVFDTRSPKVPVRSYVESHTDTITQLAFHPMQANVLLSGSTDGLVSMFDTAVAEEEDALLQVLNPRSAVHCAGFLSGTEVYVVTTDEHLSVHSLTEDVNAENGSSSVLDVGDVRPRLGCMYVVNLIPGDNPVLVCGHNVEEKLAIVHIDRSQGVRFGGVIDLPGAHGEEVVRDLVLVEGGRGALSCGEDGNVRVWDLTKAVARPI